MSLMYRAISLAVKMMIRMLKAMMMSRMSRITHQSEPPYHDENPSSKELPLMKGNDYTITNRAFSSKTMLCTRTNVMRRRNL